MRGGGPHDVLACRRRWCARSADRPDCARPAAETLRLLGALLEGRWETRDVPGPVAREASGITSAFVAWHLDRNLVRRSRMSSANPDRPITDPRSTPQQHQSFRAAHVLAIVLPLMLVALLALPVGMALARRASSTEQAPGVGIGDSRMGVGDPYFPEAGSSGYDAITYDIAIDWDAKSETMRSKAKIVARAGQPLSSFYLDLALHTDKVQVNGRDAKFETRDFQDVRITPVAPIAAGSTFGRGRLFGRADRSAAVRCGRGSAAVRRNAPVSRKVPRGGFRPPIIPRTWH